MEKQVFVNYYIPGPKGLYIIDNTKCGLECEKLICTSVCPSGVFKQSDGAVTFDSEAPCLECGACRLVCDNIFFDYPAPGCGIINRFG